MDSWSWSPSNCAYSNFIWYAMLNKKDLVSHFPAASLNTLIMTLKFHKGPHWFLLFIEILDNCLPANSDKNKQLEAVRWWCEDIPIILQKQAMSALISFSSMINSYEIYWLHTAPSLTIKYISLYRPIITSLLIFIIRQPLSESPQQQGWK